MSIPAVDLDGEVWGQSRGLGAPGEWAKGSSALSFLPLHPKELSLSPVLFRAHCKPGRLPGSVQTHIWQRQKYVPTHTGESQAGLHTL